VKGGEADCARATVVSPQHLDGVLGLHVRVIQALWFAGLLVCLQMRGPKNTRKDWLHVEANRSLAYVSKRAELLARRFILPKIPTAGNSLILKHWFEAVIYKLFV